MKRSYFIKKGIEYREIFPSNPLHSEEIIPLVGYLAFPIDELMDDTVIQDGTDLIEHFEKHIPELAMVPNTLPVFLNFSRCMRDRQEYFREAMSQLVHCDL